MALKNPYAARLEEFSSFAFNYECPSSSAARDDNDVFAHHGGWEKFFLGRMGRKPSRTVLEIGCSNAEFLTELAQANPDSAFIGIDWKFKVLYKGAKRVQERKLENVALLRARAQELDRIVGAGELDEIWVFFPDPWAKKSQLKNRLLQERFLTDAFRVLKPGGRVYFKTDHPGYYQWVLALFGQPQPEMPAYDAEAPEERSYRARQVKVRRVEQELPEPNAAIQAMFRFENGSMNYWGSARPKAMFSETLTLFEKGFVRDELPIYYAEFFKR